MDRFKAEIVEITKEVVKTEVEELVQLTMSKDAASVIFWLVGQIAGSSEGYAGDTTKVYRLLRNIDGLKSSEEIRSHIEKMGLTGSIYVKFDDNTKESWYEGY